jgi:hypothetical protein
MRIDGKGPDVSFHDFLPGAAAVAGWIAAIGYRGENDLRLFAAAGQVFELLPGKNSPMVLSVAP